MKEQTGYCRKCHQYFPIPGPFNPTADTAFHTACETRATVHERSLATMIRSLRLQKEDVDRTPATIGPTRRPSVYATRQIFHNTQSS